MSAEIEKKEAPIWIQKLKEQEFYQQIQSAFDGLAPEQQQWIRIGSVIGLFSLGTYICLQSYLDKKSAMERYQGLKGSLTLIQKSTDELRRLRGSGLSGGMGTSSVSDSVRQIAGYNGIPADGIEIAGESKQEFSNVEETLLEAKVKGLNLRSLVQFLYGIEHANPPMKIKGLNVQSSLEDGSLSANLMISGYLPKPETKASKK